MKVLLSVAGPDRRSWARYGDFHLSTAWAALTGLTAGAVPASGATVRVCYVPWRLVDLQGGGRDSYVVKYQCLFYTCGGHLSHVKPLLFMNLIVSVLCPLPLFPG